MPLPFAFSAFSTAKSFASILSGGGALAAIAFCFGDNFFIPVFISPPEAFLKNLLGLKSPKYLSISSLQDAAEPSEVSLIDAAPCLLLTLWGWNELPF